MRSSGSFNNINAIKALYNAFIIPKLEYACIVWCPQYAVKINALENVQRKFLKFLYYKTYGIYPPKGYDQELLRNNFNYKSLQYRRFVTCIMFIFKLIKGLIDNKDFLAQLPFRISRVIATRNLDLFYLNVPRTNLYKNSPLFKMCSLINSHASSTDPFCTSLTSLKIKVHQCLEGVN